MERYDKKCCRDVILLSAILTSHSQTSIHFNFILLTFCYKSNLNFSFVSLFFSLFFSADHGKIIKAVNAESADSNKKVNSVVIEELDVLPTNEPIRNLEIIRTTQYGEYERSGDDDNENGERPI